MTNINIEIPSELHKKLKIASLQSDVSLKDYCIKVLDKKTGDKNS